MASTKPNFHFISSSLDEVLQNDHYDLILDLRGNKKTLQYALTHRPKYRLDRGSIRLKNKFLGGQKNEIDTNLEVISPIINGELKNSNTICLSTVEINKTNTFIELEGLNQFAIIHIGARDKARRWPIDRFQEIIEYINKEYSMSCVLVGGEDDRNLNDSCLSGIKNKNNRNVVGEFNLIEYARLPFFFSNKIKDEAKIDTNPNSNNNLDEAIEENPSKKVSIILISNIVKDTKTILLVFLDEITL